MKVEVTSDPVVFREWVFPFLERDPVLNSVLLTSVEQRAGGRVTEAGASTFVRVLDEDGDTVGAVMRTPERPVYLGALREDAVGPVAELFAELVPDVPGVLGTEPGARQFTEHWVPDARPGRGSRLHRLGQLVEPRPAPGRPRLARTGDADLCAGWNAAFFIEIDEPGLDQLAWANERIASEALWLWEDGGRPVCLVGHQVPVFGVTRIGPVYTPAEFRGNGYASALTAHVSGLIRDRGEEACLFTDLENPTSNKIYAAIGYRPVADFVLYPFTGRDFR